MLVFSETGADSDKLNAAQLPKSVGLSTACDISNAIKPTKTDLKRQRL